MSEYMKTLVHLAKNKDAHAFSLLYEMVYKELYKMAYYTLGNVQDAEDVVSDTVLDAYATIGKLRDETAFRRWIFVILANKCNKQIKEYTARRQWVQEVDEEKETGVTQEIPDQQDDIKDILDRDEITQAFAVVSQEERFIVTLCIYGGYDSKEVASLLHMNRNTVRSKYMRALKKMQAALTE